MSCRLGRRLLLALTASAALPVALRSPTLASHAETDATIRDPLSDFATEGGHHYTQAADESAAGYEVHNDGAARWWDTYRRLGGVAILGPPVGAPFAFLGFE